MGWRLGSYENRVLFVEKCRSGTVHVTLQIELAEFHINEKIISDIAMSKYRDYILMSLLLIDLDQ
jgi:hypothetical protein